MGSRWDTFWDKQISTTPPSASCNSLWRSILHSAHESEWAGFWIRAVALNMWCPNQEPKHHLGMCSKCKFSGSSLDLLNQKLQRWGPAVCLRESPRQFRCVLESEKYCGEWIKDESFQKDTVFHCWYGKSEQKPIGNQSNYVKGKKEIFQELHRQSQWLSRWV